VKYLGAASPSLGIIPQGATSWSWTADYITFPVWLSRWRWLRSVFRQDCRRIGFHEQKGATSSRAFAPRGSAPRAGSGGYSRRRAQESTFARLL